MAPRPKAKPKPKGRKDTDKAQSARFIETARELGLTDGAAFERAIEKIVPKRSQARKP